MFGYIKSKNNLINNSKGLVKVYNKYKFKKEIKSNIKNFLNIKSLTYYDLYDFIQYIKDDIYVTLVKDDRYIIYCIIQYETSSNTKLYNKITFDRFDINNNNKKESINIIIDRLNTLDVTWRYDNTRVSFIVPPSNGFIKEYEDVTKFVKEIMVDILLFKENIHIKGVS